MTRRDRNVEMLACAVAGLIIHWPLGGPWWATAMTYVILINVEKAKRRGR